MLDDGLIVFGRDEEASAQHRDRAFGALSLAQATAADLPVLRGPIVGELAPAYNWGGGYGGAQVGFSTASINLNQNVGTLVADMLRLTTIEQDFSISSWPVLGRPNPVGGSFGGFVGYNWQWEDAVTGFEINYNRTSLTGSSGSSISRSITDSNGLPPGHHYVYDVTVAGEAAARITDWGTFRLRGGWAAGRFLPYGFVGFAVGRVDISRSGSVSLSAVDFPDQGTDPITQPGNCGLPSPPNYALCPGTSSETDSRKGVFAYGVLRGWGWTSLWCITSSCAANGSSSNSPLSKVTIFISIPFAPRLD
jgi:outer membrane immunogenic protein